MRRVVAICVVAAVATSAAGAQVRATRDFPPGECTAWTYAKRPAIVDLTVLRNLIAKVSSNGKVRAVDISDWDAWLWAINARRGGFAVGTRPAVGAVAVWPRNTDGAGPIGHVAYVEKVLSAGAFLVSEENWKGRRYLTHRVVAADSSLRFIYRAANEPRPLGSGQITLSSSGGPAGQTPSVSLRMSGRAKVLLRLAGPRGFAHESAHVLPAGTTTLALSELAGQSSLAAGYYALGILVAGGGGNYQILTLSVPGA